MLLANAATTQPGKAHVSWTKHTKVMLEHPTIAFGGRIWAMQGCAGLRVG